MLSFGPPNAQWDPFAELRHMQSQINRMLDGGTRAGSDATWPAVNIWLGDNSLVVSAEIPGVSVGDIDLTVRENTLIISGKRRPATEDEDAAWHRHERLWGDFSRSIRLPLRVDPDKVQARAQNGVLEIEMGRPDVDLPRKIEVKAS